MKENTIAIKQFIFFLFMLSTLQLCQAVQGEHGIICGTIELSELEIQSEFESEDDFKIIFDLEEIFPLVDYDNMCTACEVEDYDVAQSRIIVDFNPSIPDVPQAPESIAIVILSDSNLHDKKILSDLNASKNGLEQTTITKPVDEIHAENITHKNIKKKNKKLSRFFNRNYKN